jgi:hypothetical protein
MARLSPITIGLSALMIAIVGTALLIFARTRHAAPEPVAPDLVDEPAAPPLVPAPRAAPIAVAPPAPAPAAPPAAVETPPASADPPPPADDDHPAPPPPPDTRRALLTVNHNRRLAEADEQVFATLNLADATRASVRQINDEYRKRTERGPDRPGGPDGAESAAALQARRDALRLLLGAEPARDFDTAERMAVQRLRGKYRFEWGRQLRQ